MEKFVEYIYPHDLVGPFHETIVILEDLLDIYKSKFKKAEEFYLDFVEDEDGNMVFSVTREE